MGDVEITDVNADGSPYQEVKNLKNTDMSFMSETVGDLLSLYGWYLVVGVIVIYLLVQYLSKRMSTWSSTAPPTAQESGFLMRNQEGMEAARRRMQEDLDAKAAVFKEKQKEQEEEKRRQKIESWENLKQGKSLRGRAETSQSSEAASSPTVLKSKSEKKSLRSSDYNPLAGQGGGSCSWRPGRRGPSAGG